MARLGHTSQVKDVQMNLRMWIILALTALVLVGCGMSSEERANLRATAAASGVGANGERFDITVTGALEQALVPGFGFYQQIQELNAYQLLMVDGATELRINFTIPLSAQAGTTYPIYGDAGDLDRSGVGVGLLGKRRDLANYNTNAEGTFTITMLGDRIAGEFNFTVQTFEGATIRVVGVFSDVPLVNQ